MDVEVPSDEAGHGRFPPLHRACRDGDVAALYALLDHRLVQDPDHQQVWDHRLVRDLLAEDTCCGWTPIHWAAHCGQLECVVRLVHVGCDVNAATTKSAQTPIHIATFGGHPDCVLWLLQAGADVNRQDYAGESPIHKAARAGSTACVKALLIHGAQPDLRNATGLTAADLAYSLGFWEGFQLLSNAQNHLVQLSLTGGGGPLQGPPNAAGHRKRLIEDLENICTKKARTDYDTNGLFNGQQHRPANPSCNGYSDVLLQTVAVHRAPFKSPGDRPAEKTRLSNEESPGETAPRRSDDMCGSLHQAGSPGGVCGGGGSQMASDLGDLLHYGHYHGFGDTAEDITSSGKQQQCLV
ncbi:unnamed protein product [Merluccius merluccius]